MLQIGTVIDGKYKILNKIGQGGMSVVYLAMNERANKQWAIKEVRKDGVSNFEVVKQGLVAEVDLLKKLNHPHLPSIIDVIDGDGSFLIVMDYIEGVALDKKIKEKGSISQDDVIEWGKQLCDVLGYLHSRERPIIYRDMKPSNVMLRPDGNVMLIDFGTAREFKSNSVADTTCLGTQGYAAPEQFGGQGQTDARTDVYCLGATLYHLVTGHNPCEYPYEMYPIRQWNPSLSSGLESIIIKCTQKNPNDRYQSCAELMYALEHYRDFDIETLKKQNVKWYSFLSVFLASVLFFGASGGLKIKSDRDNEYLYKEYINNAVTSDDFVDLRKAILLYPKEIKPYEKALEIIEKDDVFTKNENNEYRMHLENNEDNDKKKTLYSSDEYLTFIYELGLDYFFCYENDMAGWSYAQKCFGKIKDAAADESRKGEFPLKDNQLKNAEILYTLSGALTSKHSQTAGSEADQSIELIVPGYEDEKTGAEEYTEADYWNDLTGILDSEIFVSANSVTKRKVYTWICHEVKTEYNELLLAGITKQDILAIRDKCVIDIQQTLNSINDTGKSSYQELNTLLSQYQTLDEYWR